jgi:hypothetical protein
VQRIEEGTAAGERERAPRPHYCLVGTFSESFDILLHAFVYEPLLSNLNVCCMYSGRTGSITCITLEASCQHIKHTYVARPSQVER